MKYIRINDKRATTNHTFQYGIGEDKIWVSKLTSTNPDLDEYKISFTNGVVRYITLPEMIGQADHLIPFAKKLTEKINPNDVKVINGELYTK